MTQRAIRKIKQLTIDIQLLTLKLEAVVSREDYESAAFLRDIIASKKRTIEMLYDFDV
jgi:protein-arginine kinase activator protein McsA